MAGTESNFGNYRQDEVDATIAAKAAAETDGADKGVEQTPLEKVKEQMGDQYAELTKALGYNETYDPERVLQSYEDRKGRGEFRDTPDEELDVITDGIAKLREALK